MTRPPRKPSEEDSRLFRKAMENVTPLPGRERKPGAETAAPPAPPAPSASPVVRPQPQAAAAPPRPPPDAPPELLPGVAPGLDRRTLDRLRRGQIRPEARLDLHGMTQDRAFPALHGFIVRSHAAGLRCVVVVTGKGSLSTGGGVLRRQVPFWLNQPPSRPLLLGFAEAPPRDGGKGALMVLLRRQRAAGAPEGG